MSDPRPKTDSPADRDERALLFFFFLWCLGSGFELSWYESLAISVLAYPGMVNISQSLRLQAASPSYYNRKPRQATTITFLFFNDFYVFYHFIISPVVDYPLTFHLCPKTSLDISLDKPPWQPSILKSSELVGFVKEAGGYFFSQGVIRRKPGLDFSPHLTPSLYSLQDFKTCHCGTDHLSSLQPAGGGALLPPGRALRGYCRRPA